jgi:hypothetical protein
MIYRRCEALTNILRFGIRDRDERVIGEICPTSLDADGAGRSHWMDTRVPVSKILSDDIE